VDVFPEPTGLTAMPSMARAPVPVVEVGDALLIASGRFDGFMKNRWLTPGLTRTLSNH